MNARIHRLPACSLPDEEPVELPDEVAAALDRCDEQYPQVSARPATTHIERAERAEAMAALCELEAELWHRLGRWAFVPEHGVPRVFGRAAILAAEATAERGRLYVGVAADYRRMVAGLPVCGVVGCGCGGDCGVPA